MLSKKALALKPSPTLALAAKAKELQASGKDVVSLTVGEPDWPTFEVANQAGVKAIQSGFTKYTVASGIPELKKAVAEQTSQQLGTLYTPKNVVIGAGAKFLIYAALQMILDPGDEVIIPSPYWVSYPVMTELSDGVAKIVNCGAAENFLLTPLALQRAITPKTKVLVLCSPSNPTGLLYSRKQLEDLAAVLKHHPRVMILSDDIYNRLLFTGESVAPHLLHVAPDLKNRMIVVNGASKSYSMTGWRVAWALAPENLTTALSDFVSQTTSNASSISQMAALSAIQQGEPELSQALQKLIKKKDWALQQFAGLKFMKAVPPDGAFYIWARVSDCFGKTHKGIAIKGSKDVAEILLNDYFVATVPGIEFGDDQFLRLSIAASDQALEKAFQRFQQFESNLGKA